MGVYVCFSLFICLLQWNLPFPFSHLLLFKYKVDQGTRGMVCNWHDSASEGSVGS